MTKSQFREHFLAAIEMAAKNAEERCSRPIPQNFVVQLHGAGHSGEEMSVDAAAEVLYIDGGRFYRIIDLAVVSVSKDVATLFIRASSHTPGSLEQTWNNPPGSGPFKQIVAEEVKFT